MSKSSLYVLSSEPGSNCFGDCIHIWKTKTIFTVFLVHVFLPGWGSAEDIGAQLSQRAFTKCVTCHSLEEGQHGVGPSLYKLDNRQAGTVARFKFSKAMRTSELVWTSKTLDAYLLNPQQYIRRNRMAFSGPKNDEERTALVCFLLGTAPYK